MAKQPPYNFILLFFKSELKKSIRDNVENVEISIEE